MRGITLEALEVLDAIDRRGSFAGAAESLHRVPSKVTYTVNKLQDDLGVRLFRRVGRRSVLTPAGELLLEQGRELLQAAERLAEKTRQAEHGWETRLRIALDSVLDMDFLAPHIAAFCGERPNTEVEIATEVLGGTWEAVQTGRADLAIGAADVAPAVSGLSCTPLMNVEWVFAVAPTHPLARTEQPLSEEARLGHRAVVVRDSSRQSAARSLRVMEKQQRLTVATIEQKIAAQCAGLGAGFLPRSRVAELLSGGQLVEIHLEHPQPDSMLYLAWRSADKGRALQWFTAQLCQRPTQAEDRL